METNGDAGTGAAAVPPPRVDPGVLATLRAQVVDLAEATVRAIAAEVPNFVGVLDGPFRAELEDGVRMAYDGFVGVLADGDPDGTTLARARRGAYALGRAEARAHRSIDVLLASYRVGARVHWEHLSNAVVHQMTAAQVAELAAFVFAYGDHLSAASVTGHADESASASRMQAQRRERLARALIEGDPHEAILRRAEQAQWPLPTTLTVVLLPSMHAAALAIDPDATLTMPIDEPGLPVDDLTAVLIPDVHRDRPHLLTTLSGRNATVGPAREWHDAATSYQRALRALSWLPRPPDARPLDTDNHLTELLLFADPATLADLRRQALAPLDDLPDDTAERLAHTLRSWLLHQGRRQKVAANLQVHPQTVRYRMAQIRDRYADRLDNPDEVLTLLLALASPPATSARARDTD